METGRVEECLGVLEAVEPTYHPQYGDACYLHLNDGQVLLERRSMRGVKDALLRMKALDPVYLRRLCGEQLGRHLSMPLPLSAGVTLAALKMRQPVCSNDTAYGLVNLSAVCKVVRAVDGNALVHLHSGRCLKITASRETTLSRLAEANLVRQHFVQNVWQI